MKTKTNINPLLQRAALLLLGLTTINPQLSTFAQGTAFTYQGRFNDNGVPFTGNIEFQFTLWDAISAGGMVGSTNSVFAAATNGLFTVTLDFGAGAFPGADRWLQIEARTTFGAFTPLNPRQPVTPAPYAIYSGKAMMLDGALPTGQLSGVYSNAVTLNNAGNSFSGSGSGLTGLNASQLTSGAVPPAALDNAWKTTGNLGTTAGTHFLGTSDGQPLEFRVNGQRALRIEDNGDGQDAGTIPDGAPNVIGGSQRNFVAAGVVGATISGGGATNYYGASFGSNAVFADFATIGGGVANRIAAGSTSATIAGGDQNTNQATWATIGGGSLNAIRTNAIFSTISGGRWNAVLAGADYSFIACGSFNQIAGAATHATVGGGLSNNAAGDYAVIAGGSDNHVGTNAVNSTIGGGIGNNISQGSRFATIAGGALNDISPSVSYSTIAGGCGNTIGANATFATIPGGLDNTASGIYAFAAGRRAKANHTGAFVWADSTDADFSSTAADQFLIRADGGVGIGLTAPDAPLHVTGGADVTTNSGGNIISGSISSQNIALDGNEIMARNNGNTATLALNANGGNITLCQSDGNVSINTTTADSPLRVFAARCDGVTWIDASDRNLKSGFASVDAREVLEKVVQLPVTRWRYKTDAGTEHLGPVAQDFHAAFGLGSDDISIASVDAHGVALAAIQGLNEKLTAELKRRDAENAELKRELGELKQLVGSLAGKLNGGAK